MPLAELEDALLEEEGVGKTDTDVGEFELRQLVSSDVPTSLRSELPPCLPLESTILKMMVVPAATSASQSNDVGPFGGVSTNVSPPGINPFTWMLIEQGASQVQWDPQRW